MDSSRTLTNVEVIRDIRPIPGADSVEAGSVRGWNVVVGKDDFHNGDMVVFIEPDAALPLDDDRFGFLRPRGVTIIDGEPYHVVKTVRLRGHVSQGIVFPLNLFPEVWQWHLAQDQGSGHMGTLDETLGVRLWEPPVPVKAPGIIGPWDTPWLKKTDAERVQNLTDAWLAAASQTGGEWVATEKIDGASTTVILTPGGGVRLFGRNWELTMDSTVGSLVDSLNLAAWMSAHHINAVQGEFVGPKVNGNRLKLREHRLYWFAAWHHDAGQAVDRLSVLYEHGADAGLTMAPIIDVAFPRTIAQALASAHGMSQITPTVPREGIVWHHKGAGVWAELADRSVFKAVSTDYLLTHGL